MSAHLEVPVARPRRPQRRSGAARALLAGLLATLVLGFTGAGALAGPALATTEPPDPPPPTYNEFYPAERDLSDCLSALPKPGCGSEARGGFHQTAVFVVLVAGLAVIGTRIAIGIRRRDRELADSQT